MAESSKANAPLSRKPMRAPRGTALSCQGWHQEAALRLLMNSADPAVAEHPEQLIPSGGIGKLARDWQAFHAILEALQKLEGSQTLLVHSGRPLAVLQTQENAPRVIAVNAGFLPSSDGEKSAGTPFAAPSQAPRIEPIAPIASITPMAIDWMFAGPMSALPEAFEIFRAAAREHFGGTLAGRLVVAAGMGGMGGAQALAATLNGAAFLGIDADAGRIKRRVKAGFCEIMVNDLDEALRILKNAVRKREPASVGLIGNAAEIIPELADRGVLPDLLTDQTPADDPSGAYIPRGLSPAQASEWREELGEKDPHACRERALDSIAAQVSAMLELKKLGSIVFEFGNGICASAFVRGVAGASEIPDFVSEYLLPDLTRGRGLLTVAALSGDPEDLARVDALVLELFPNSALSEWMAIVRRHPSPGLPARSFWMAAGEAAKFGAAINGLVGNGEIKAPVAIGRCVRLSARAKPPINEARSQCANSAALAPALSAWPSLAALLHAASGASWVALRTAAGPGEIFDQTSCFAVVADGHPASAERIARVFTNDSIAAASLFAI